MATKARKVRKAKPEKASAPKVEKVLGYFKPDSAVGCIAEVVADEKVHKIESILSHVQKEQKVGSRAAQFAFRVLFINKYPGSKIGKIQAKGLGHATVNFAVGKVQFHKGSGKTTIIPAMKAGKKDTKTKQKSKTPVAEGHLGETHNLADQGQNQIPVVIN